MFKKIVCNKVCGFFENWSPHLPWFSSHHTSLTVTPIVKITFYTNAHFPIPFQSLKDFLKRSISGFYIIKACASYWFQIKLRFKGLLYPSLIENVFVCSPILTRVFLQFSDFQSGQESPILRLKFNVCHLFYERRLKYKLSCPFLRPIDRLAK